MNHAYCSFSFTDMTYRKRSLFNVNEGLHCQMVRCINGLLTSHLVLPKNTGLASSNSTVSGSVVYGFQTPKRHGGLAQAGELNDSVTMYENHENFW